MTDPLPANSLLKSRVQSLRLPPPGPSAVENSNLPWLLVFVLSGVIACLLLFGSPFAATSPTTISAHSETTAATVTPLSLKASAGAGPVVESKGYIIPEQQI